MDSDGRDEPHIIYRRGCGECGALPVDADFRQNSSTTRCCPTLHGIVVLELYCALEIIRFVLTARTLVAVGSG